jgi:poly-gamma-glutamate synthesis protein (capsule biosynthesis protein)
MDIITAFRTRTILKGSRHLAHSIAKSGGRRFGKAGVYLACLFSIAACQSSLWGAPPPPPTIAPPSPMEPASTYTPILPTAAPTPVVLEAAQVWASQAVPHELRQAFQNWGFQVQTDDRQTARLTLDVAISAPGESHVSVWTYALVAPFPTLTDNVNTQELLSAWIGYPLGPFSGVPLLMEQSTLEGFSRMWGEPAQGAVQVVEAARLLETAWRNMPSWAIIPFGQVDPRWKVLTVDGQSPMRRNFDPAVYPLNISYLLRCTNSCRLPDEPRFSVKNHDPGKLTTVILTGVTAMARATAKTMDVKGITYPGEELREMFREGDILHINNEVPFYGGCPDPDPDQKKQIFCSRPRYMGLLTDIGMDVVELSGDHFADYREQAMVETLDIYDRHKIPYYGGGRNIDDGRKPLLMEVNGNKIMFIGCNYKTIYASATDSVPGSVPCDFDYMTEQIRAHRARGYLPIATFQYHEFDSPEARPQQKRDFRRMAEAGAVIVSGSQAHVPQVMEFHQQAFIHYGLGNLFFDQIDPRGPQLTQHEFIDRHVFYEGRYLGVELITAFLEDYARPRYMTEAERMKFLAEYFIESGWDFPQAGQ